MPVAPRPDEQEAVLVRERAQRAQNSAGRDVAPRLDGLRMSAAMSSPLVDRA